MGLTIVLIPGRQGMNGYNKLKSYNLLSRQSTYTKLKE